MHSYVQTHQDGQVGKFITINVNRYQLIRPGGMVGEFIRIHVNQYELIWLGSPSWPGGGIHYNECELISINMARLTEMAGWVNKGLIESFCPPQSLGVKIIYRLRAFNLWPEE
jgi:hypothetical protein